MVRRARSVASFSHTAANDKKSWWPMCDAIVSRWWFTAHSNFVISACPVPTYFVCKWSQLRLRLKRSAAMSQERTATRCSRGVHGPLTRTLQPSARTPGHCTMHAQPVRARSISTTRVPSVPGTRTGRSSYRASTKHSRTCRAREISIQQEQKTRDIMAR